MYNDQEYISTDDEVWIHDWMTFCMIIAIIHCDLALILKSHPKWMELDAGAFNPRKIIVNSRYRGSCILGNSFPKYQVNAIFRPLSVV